MGPRPLRQYYGEDVRIDVDDALGPIVEPWLRHRRRFADRLGELDDGQWATTTRCDGWDTRDVVNHLITVDGFWIVSLQSAAAGAPTSFLVDFNPTDSPEALVEPMRAMSTGDVLDQFRTGTTRFIDAVTALDGGSWSSLGESPLGHVTARLALAHAFWDSWLHERDVFLPLGVDVPVERDELAVATWYALVAGAVQGGLIGDPSPVGPGLAQPIDASLVFDDLPDHPIRIVIDAGVRLERAGAGIAPTRCGSALDLVETFTGRRSDPTTPAIPSTLAEHLTRAFQIL